MKNKLLIPILFLMTVLACPAIKAQVSFGEARKFNDGWLFSLSDDSLSRRNDYDDKGWRRLDLPHDWSVEGQLSPSLASCTGYLPGGIGWYRKHFTVTDDAPRHYIYFEGAYNRSEVYLNGHLLGKRPNGYISFMYDMTPFLKEGDNVIAVRIDHSRHADSRWYTGSGIYRDVWVVSAPEIHFAQWGVDWQATSITDKRATIAVGMEVKKHKEASGKLEVEAILYDAAGKAVAQGRTRIGDRKALEILRKAGETFGIPVVTDIHTAEEAAIAAEYVDVLQIPAFLCRQTDLLVAAARTGKMVNIKKGQFLSPEAMRFAVEKVKDSGNDDVAVTERGTTFGYQDLVVDFRGIPTMRRFAPVILDVTHSLQQPNQTAGVTGGLPQLIETVARCGIAAGADGLFMETHQNPAVAKSDGANMLPLDRIAGLLERLTELRLAVKRLDE